MPRLQYSASEAARQLSIGTRTLWRYVRAGKLSTVALGGRRFFRHADLAAFIDAHLDTSGAPGKSAPAGLIAKNRASKGKKRTRKAGKT
ncbi:MAG: helix-turn-helix domain-containing protein [Spirochaetia bacterium]